MKREKNRETRIEGGKRNFTPRGTLKTARRRQGRNRYQYIPSQPYRTREMEIFCGLGLPCRALKFRQWEAAELLQWLQAVDGIDE